MGEINRRRRRRVAPPYVQPSGRLSCPRSAAGGGMQREPSHATQTAAWGGGRQADLHASPNRKIYLGRVRAEKRSVQ